jgi:hypothetical protein
VSHNGLAPARFLRDVVMPAIANAHFSQRFNPMYHLAHILFRRSTFAATTAFCLLFAAPAALTAAEAIRIKAAATAPMTDAAGVKWEADSGFVGGETIDRTGTEIANTKTPSLYTSERYSMTAFARAVPNGKYVVKLHFAETFEGIYGTGQRVFSFNVEGKEFKDFDVWAKAGGAMKAYVETVDVEVTDGKLDITFTANIENPQINALEIIPAG